MICNLKVIGFTGKMYSGKSSCAKYLMHNYGYQRMGFADPIRTMMRSLGVAEEALTDASWKEIPLEILGNCSVRQVMQEIGGGLRRINEDIFVNIWLHHLKSIPPEKGIVVDDVRFQNEIDQIHQLGGVVIQLKGGKTPVEQTTKSTHLTEIQELNVDAIIQNNGSILDLYENVLKTINNLQIT